MVFGYMAIGVEDLVGTSENTGDGQETLTHIAHKQLTWKFLGSLVLG